MASPLELLPLLNLVPCSRRLGTPGTPLSPDFLLCTAQEEPQQQIWEWEEKNAGFSFPEHSFYGDGSCLHHPSTEGHRTLKMGLSMWLCFWLPVTMASSHRFLLTGDNRQTWDCTTLWLPPTSLVNNRIKGEKWSINTWAGMSHRFPARSLTNTLSKYQTNGGYIFMLSENWHWGHHSWHSLMSLSENISPS